MIACVGDGWVSGSEEGAGFGGVNECRGLGSGDQRATVTKLAEGTVLVVWLGLGRPGKQLGTWNTGHGRDRV